MWTIDQIVEHAKETEQNAYKPEAHSVCIDNLAMCLQALIQNIYPVASATQIYQEAVDRWRSRDLLKVCEETLEAIQTWHTALENRIRWTEYIVPPEDVTHHRLALDRDLINGMSMSETSLLAAIAKAKGQT